jgi:hypothetical protein
MTEVRKKRGRKNCRNFVHLPLLIVSEIVNQIDLLFTDWDGTNNKLQIINGKLQL